MSGPACSHEPRVLEAATNGRWEPSLAAHVAGCEGCADLALVSATLQAAEAPRELEVNLEQASRIWRVADAEQRRNQAARALLPVAIGEFAACLFGGVALLAFAAKYVMALLPSTEAVALRLLADPVVWPLAGVVAVLLAGVLLCSLALALGLRAARSS